MEDVTDSYTVLVAEDEPMLLKLVATVLVQDGLRVLQACNGRKALECAQAHTGRIDLLLTDILMPEMNGTELGRRIREFHPSIKVLYMSGFTQDIIFRNTNGEALVEEILSKPISPMLISEIVRKTLAGRKQPA